MKVRESFNYNDMSFKRVSSIMTEAENKFITEEMITSPLYKKIKVENDIRPYEFFPLSDVRVECYCKECDRRRIFSFEDSQIALNNLMSGMTPGSMTLPSEHKINSLSYELKDIDFFTLSAQADCKHKMIILFRVIDGGTIMKVGQFPSIYDMNENINNKKFSKLLGEEYFEYYKKSCSLYSFDTYIGALVYLRRIYEKLLIDTFNENKDDLEMQFDEFKEKRMDEKIKYLKKYLPQIMFEQGFNVIYTKISDGIHNLTEDECSKIFLVLKMGVEEILIEKLEKNEKKNRIKELSKELQNA